jgi:hypothetical protein
LYILIEIIMSVSDVDMTRDDAKQLPEHVALARSREVITENNVQHVS